MALKPKITIKQSPDCTHLILCDVTGIYDVSDNPGGYGFPNATSSSSVTLTVTEPGGNVLAPVTLQSGSSNLQPGKDCVCIKVIPTDVGLQGSTFADGVYVFTYIALDATGAELGSFTLNVFLKCLATKCINQIIMETCDSGCLGCGDNLVEVAAKMKAMLDGAEYATSVGAYACAEKILTRVQDQCDYHCTNCG